MNLRMKCFIGNFFMVIISYLSSFVKKKIFRYIEIAWSFSTLFGLLLFLIEIAILCWVKFYDLSKAAAWSACIILIPVLIVFVAFAVHFYRSLVTHKYEVTISGIRELEILKEQMEQDHREQPQNNPKQNSNPYYSGGDMA